MFNVVYNTELLQKSYKLLFLFRSNNLYFWNQVTTDKILSVSTLSTRNLCIDFVYKSFFTLPTLIRWKIHSVKALHFHTIHIILLIYPPNVKRKIFENSLSREKLRLSQNSCTWQCCECPVSIFRILKKKDLSCPSFRTFISTVLNRAMNYSRHKKTNRECEKGGCVCQKRITMQI